MSTLSTLTLRFGVLCLLYILGTTKASVQQHSGPCQARAPQPTSQPSGTGGEPWAPILHGYPFVPNCLH